VIRLLDVPEAIDAADIHGCRDEGVMVEPQNLVMNEAQKLPDVTAGRRPSDKVL